MTDALHVEYFGVIQREFSVPTTSGKIFGDNLCRIREERKLTQEQLAERVGKDRTSIIQWEAGRSPPDQMKDKLAKALSVTPDAFWKTDVTEYRLPEPLPENPKETVRRMNELLKTGKYEIRKRVKKRDTSNDV